MRCREGSCFNFIAFESYLVRLCVSNIKCGQSIFMDIFVINLVKQIVEHDTNLKQHGRCSLCQRIENYYILLLSSLYAEHFFE